MGIFALSSCRAFVRSGTDAGREGLAQSLFQFTPKVFDGAEVRAPSRPIKFFHTKLPCFVHWGTVMLDLPQTSPKSSPPNCTVGTMQSSR